MKDSVRPEVAGFFRDDSLIHRSATSAKEKVLRIVVKLLPLVEQPKKERKVKK